MRLNKISIPESLMKYIKLIIKITVSTIAIWYIFSNIDAKALWHIIKNSNPYIIISAFCIYTISILLSSVRLNVLFKLLPLRITQISNLKLYYLGLFYNFFLPGGVGGDGYKVFILNRKFRIPVKKLIGAALADRISGLSAILVYLLSLVYFINYDLPFQGWFWVLIPTVGLGYYAFLYLFSRNLTHGFWKVNGWSLLIQGLQMVAAILLLEAMGARVVGHRDDFVFLFLLSAIAASVPITLGGIGAREFTLLKGAILLGLNKDHAVALSLMFYAISLIAAIPGIYYSINSNEIFNTEEIPCEEELPIVEKITT